VTWLNTIDRAHGCESLGYTPRQAQFLALVAVHSGYFLRRQYTAFADTHDGAIVEQLVDRLIALRHAVYHVGPRDTRLYHLRSRGLYAALGLGDSRNRRPALPSAIATKLMTVDVVLQWRGRLVLGTEEEKVRFFTEDWNLPLHRLPATAFPSAKPGGGVSVHYFVDRSPIILTPGTPEVTVAYVHGWLNGIGGFAAFLQQYQPLLSGLPKATIVFCTARTDVIPAARQAWAATFLAGAGESELVADRADVLVHFRRRHLAETAPRREPESVVPRAVDPDTARYRRPAWEALYQRWRVAGDVVLEAIQPVAAAVQAAPVPRFETLVLRHPYPVCRSHPAPADTSNPCP
jgi:hypothetical protein